MTTNKNTVKISQPSVIGALAVADIGTPLPITANEELDPAFKRAGYITEDGLSKSTDFDSTDINAWGGDVIETIKTKYVESFGLSLAQEDLAELKILYADNASISGDGVRLENNIKRLRAYSYVIDIVQFHNGVSKSRRRIVIPEGHISELGEIGYKDEELTVYPITIATIDDPNKVHSYEYIEPINPAPEQGV